jgi:hypothetical protein
MDEYGVFNDEGCVEREFYSEADAEKARAERYADDDDCVVRRCCPDHPDQPYVTCQECDE